MVQYTLLFFVTMATDSLWAYYIAHTASKNVWKSTLSSGAIVLSGAYVVTSYVEDHWALAPAVIGGMIGTFLTVKYSKNTE